MQKSSESANQNKNKKEKDNKNGINFPNRTKATGHTKIAFALHS